MESETKIRLIAAYSRNLKSLRPDLGNHFMCPTCLEVIPTGASKRISEEHIIPKSAGGGLSTLLCTRCNNTFGKDQAKWFGEYMRLHGLPIDEKLRKAAKGTRFQIDGTSVDGMWDLDKDGNICYYIDRRRNAPDKVSALRRYLTSNLRAISASKPPVQIDAHKRLVSIGFLTAAYLIWFRQLGYSWVLQSHLNSIRRQILNPNEHVLENGYLADLPSSIDSPCTSVAEFGGHYLPVVGIADRIVLFPSQSAPEILHRYPPGTTG